jgi:hypothetical protein
MRAFLNELKKQGHIKETESHIARLMLKDEK